jgi:predicted Rossmann fold nucleotide-binding protein DprA/Smf involved in DNA uptake
MTYVVKKIETSRLEYLSVINKKDFQIHYPNLWTIGNLDILEMDLLGFFCSVKCPGNVILKTYDLARELRDAGIAVISGFHSPIEKDCLDLLLKGTQPVAICPARGIENMRIPKAWQNPMTENRLLIISPFEPKHRRPTTKLAEQRNKFGAYLANKIFVAHASEASQTERFCTEIITLGKQIHTFNIKENYQLSQFGVVKVSISALIADFK